MRECSSSLTMESSIDTLTCLCLGSIHLSQDDAFSVCLLSTDLSWYEVVMTILSVDISRFIELTIC